MSLLAALLAITATGGVRAQLATDSHPAGIRLRVTEPIGIPRSQAPVLAGVPLPVNAGIMDAAAFELRDQNGTAIPFNARVLARWNRPADDPRAPIRWLALTFAADLQPLSTVMFEIVPTADAVAGTSIATIEPDGIHVDTGTISFRVAVEGGGLLDNLRIDMNGDRRVDVRLIGEGGAELQWPGPEGMTPVPLRASLHSSGLAAAIVRLEAEPTGNSAPACLSGCTPTAIAPGCGR